MINWSETTPIYSLFGGVIIGVAASILILLNGKIAGISGIIGGLLRPKRGDVNWRVLFIIGLVISPSIYRLFHTLPQINITASYWDVFIAGLLVGIGTRFGSGCTSGHGICGLSRLSKRSVVATLCFMLAGIVTVFITQHLL